MYNFDYIYVMQRVTRPKGGINERLHWLSVPLHRKMDSFLRQISAKGKSRVLPSADNAGDLMILAEISHCNVDHTRITFTTNIMITDYYLT